MRRRFGMIGAVSGGGTDPYFSSVVSLMHFNGTDASTSIIDEIGPVWGCGGEAKLSTVRSLWGGSSLIVNAASGTYLSTARSNIPLGAGDFAVEGFFYLIGKPYPQPCVFSNYNSFGSGSLSLFAGHAASSTTKYQIACNGTFPAIESSISIAYGVWTHLAVVRRSGVITLYVNGVADGTFNASGVTLNGSGSDFFIGASPDNISATRLEANIEEWRVTVGVPRYTADFTPPTSQMPDS